MAFQYRAKGKVLYKLLGNLSGAICYRKQGTRLVVVQDDRIFYAYFNEKLLRSWGRP